MGKAARAAAAMLSVADTAQKNRALLAMADAIDAAESALLAANEKDLAAATGEGHRCRLAGSSGADPGTYPLHGRRLAQCRCAGRSGGCFVGDQIAEPSGLEIARMRVPLGVIGVIYESRPNVTADAAGLCIKSGNVVILRGGSEAFHSNHAIAACVRAGLVEAGLPKRPCSWSLPPIAQRSGRCWRMDDYVDVIIPRGGKGLVKRISEEARVPVIKHLDGICHVFIDAGADRATGSRGCAECQDLSLWYLRFHGNPVAACQRG